MLLSNDLVTLLRLILGILATASLADLLVWQKVMQPVREAAGIQHDDSGTRMGHDDSFFASVLWCFRCTGVWAAIFLVMLWVAFAFLYDVVALVLALSYASWRLYEKI